MQLIDFFVNHNRLDYIDVPVIYLSYIGKTPDVFGRYCFILGYTNDYSIEFDELLKNKYPKYTVNCIFKVNNSSNIFNQCIVNLNLNLLFVCTLTNKTCKIICMQNKPYFEIVNIITNCVENKINLCNINA